MKTNSLLFMLNYCEICVWWRNEWNLDLQNCICSFAGDISSRTSSRSSINDGEAANICTFAPSDKHIKSSSQETGSLLAAVVSIQSQDEPEDKTMEDNGRRRKRSETSLDAGNSYTKQEVKYEWDEAWIKVPLVRYHHRVFASTWLLGINPKQSTRCLRCKFTTAEEMQ